MQRFTALYLELDQTTRTSVKVAALARYFREAPPLDAAWAVYVLSGRRMGKAVSSRLLRELAAEQSGYAPWLIDQCYRVVGDLSEALSLLVPNPGDGSLAPTLSEMIEQRIKPMAQLTRPMQRAEILSTWAQLSTEQRMVFHKLITGVFRVGVSRQMMVRGLAQAAGVDPGIIAHRLAGHWSPDALTMDRLLRAHDPTAATDPGLPYPFMLAHPLQEAPSTLGDPGDWLIEWKWDGIRAQVIRREKQVTLWSRGDEAVAGAFPEIVQAASGLPVGTVMDGEIVAWDEAADRPEPFTRLQRRLNRQNVQVSFWPEVPVTFMAFDALEIGGRDVRGMELSARRELLESTVKSLGAKPMIQMSAPVQPQCWEQLAEWVADSRRRGVEGVMLKRRISTYQPGRPTGPWWKLKVSPLTMDAVMIAAEPGHGRRAGLLTDYTFGVWDGSALVPITKAYSGLTDEEIAEVDRFARQHTVSRHGPVHVVQPLRVFEIGFEAIQLSNRHQSGLAVRFPRILRMRPDKTPAEADHLQTMRDLLTHVEAMR